jgi:DNA-binding beta-propeller fold protein YncE
LLAAYPAAWAHPGVGIVRDARGSVFFTDLKQVWRIAPDDSVSVAVPGVHSHELCLDAQDNLYGEHLWYEGDATGRWGHRVWRRGPDGSVADVIPTREGFLRDYSFVRDRAGTMYWADRGEATVIRRRTPGGPVVVHAAGGFRDVGWMAASPDGVLFLIDAGDLRRVAPDGTVTTLAARLSAVTPPPQAASGRHYHMGLWTDGSGAVYVAVAGEGLVLRVGPGGTATTAARSPRGWAPSGGLVDPDGSLWLLEYSTGLFRPSEVRVRRVDRGGAERVFEARQAGPDPEERGAGRPR